VVVLGVDPGSRFCGYGLLRADRRGLAYLASGRVRLDRRDSLAVRLAVLQGALEEILDRHRPDVSAVEKVFFAKSARSALSLGHARGVVLAALARAGIPVDEYSALEVKKAVVGYGRADKRQVQEMVAMLLRIRNPLVEDEADALAVAICHANTRPGGGP